MKNKIKVAFVGYGQRGVGILSTLLKMSDVEIVAVCDKYEDRTQMMVEKVQEERGIAPFATQNYKEIIAQGSVDAAVICTSWSAHVPLTIDFMEAGIRVGFEVGGCDSVDECWELVQAYRRTGVEVMMLENCCYGKTEMMILNMVKQGVFGEVVHCDGGYVHDLREEIVTGKEKRQYRLDNYLNRNCDNYPTHALGPIAKILNINHGNRMISLCSMASKAAGLKEYIREHDIKNKELIGREFAQGDVITTMIKCAHGETITLTLDTTLPHYYSRNFNIDGTKAKFDENTQSFFFGEKDNPEGEWKDAWGNFDEYHEIYGHPLWKEYEQVGIKSGHGGMDWLVLRAFVESVKNETKPPIDVYDAVAWMVITPLSEASIAKGSMPVEIPDFTNGKWIEPYDGIINKYSLDTICIDRDTPIHTE